MNRVSYIFYSQLIDSVSGFSTEITSNVQVEDAMLKSA